MTAFHSHLRPAIIFQKIYQFLDFHLQSLHAMPTCRITVEFSDPTGRRQTFAWKLNDALSGPPQRRVRRRRRILHRVCKATISAIENDRVNLGVERAKVFARALKCHPAVLVFPGWEVPLERAA